MKLYGARESLRQALQSPNPIKYVKDDDNPDQRKTGKKPKKQGAQVRKALFSQRGAF